MSKTFVIARIFKPLALVKTISIFSASVEYIKMIQIEMLFSVVRGGLYVNIWSNYACV